MVAKDDQNTLSEEGGLARPENILAGGDTPPRSSVLNNEKDEQDEEQTAGPQGQQPEMKQTADEEAPLGWFRLLLIWVGIWFAVFLYSLVRNSCNFLAN